jgi:hypothetical protein
MDEFVIPVSKPRLDFGFEISLLGGLELYEEEPELLSKRMQALPPVAAAVLVAVADEDFVEELLDVVQHCLVVRSGDHEGACADGGRGGHLGSFGGLADGHCEDDVDVYIDFRWNLESR